MHSEIDIQVNGQSMVLQQDFSLDVTEENPLFHDSVSMRSDPVQAPMDGNRQIFQNVDDPQSDLRPVSLEHLPALIHVAGFPLRSGVITVGENEELKDAFSFNIDQSAQSLEDIIGDMKCQDVPLLDKIPIGQKICNVEARVRADITVVIRGAYIDGVVLPAYPDEKHIDEQITFDPQALGFSYPGIAERGNTYNKDGKISYDTGGVKSYPEGITVNVPKVTKSYINVSEPYGSGWQYCNARVCYAHYGLDESDKEDDVEKQHGSVVLLKHGTIGSTSSDIMRVNENTYSVNEDYGPYWVLDANRPQSGICFYVLYFLDCLFTHLGLAFDKSALMQIEDMTRLAFFTTHCKYYTESSEVQQQFGTLYALNKWLSDRGCGGQIEIIDPDEKDLSKYDLTFHNKLWHLYTEDKDQPSGNYVKVSSIKASGEITWSQVHAKVSTMYATNENFPDVSVSEVLDSLEQSFGIKFYYDYENRKVTAYLLRYVFRSQAAPIDLPCTVLECNKLSEKITGVRVKYSAESDGTEQSRNVRTGKRDYDTDFDYIDYPEKRTQVGDGYIEIAKDRRTENTTVYIDRLTGDAYRWKISKESTTGNVSEHRLFEVGQFKGIEVGDCSPQNEDFVKELVSDFQPMSFNDVNAYAEINRGSTQPVMAAYVDEDMEHEFVTQKITHPIYSDLVDIYVTEVLQTIESYDPSGTEDGNSPLQSYDWGLAISVMRGGGADATIERYDYGYDGFNNAKWRTVAGNYAMFSDTMDQFGNVFDYNGQDPGTGGGERFSLKIRSYKQPDWAEAPLCVEDRAVRMRGLADTFLSEYIYFLLNRKKFRIHCLMEPAQLADIPNHWSERFCIGDKVGYIDTLKYSLTAQEGIGEVQIDFFAL